MPHTMTRAAYAQMFGPTVGDKVRLADTDLVIEVEKDFTTYGEEVKFGGGKVIRDGMGQSQRSRSEGAVDSVITNALILDHWGIVKADVGIRDGCIAAIGKAGNPDVQPNVDIIIGPGTEVIAGEGNIVTAGRHRYARSLHLSAADRGGGIFRPYYDDWRRHGAGGGDDCHDLHPGTLAHPTHAPSCRCVSYQSRDSRQGQCKLARGSRRADRGRRLRAEAPRRLGEHPCCHRLLPVGRR